jgi:hypothetical protein
MRRSVVLLGALVLVALIAVPAALAGTGGNKTGQACYKGMYAYYQDPSTGRPFASQDACVSYVANGGALTPEVDISLAFNKSSQSAGTLAVHNGGLVAETVTIDASFVWSSLGVTGEVSVSPQCSYTHDSAGDTVGAHCSATVAAGQTVNVLDVDVSGGASVQGTAFAQTPTYPDPDTSNNLVNFSLTS